LLVRLLPSPHVPVRIDNRLDVFNYVFLFPGLVMKRDFESRQWIEDHPDVHLRPTGHTQMYIRQFQTRMARVTHLADGLANDVRERVKDLDGGAEALYQFSIVIAIFLEGLFSFMEELEVRLGRIRLFESDSKGGFGEVCASKFGVGQGCIDDRMDGRSRGC